MKNYVEENQRILVNWEQEYKNRGNVINFCPDGIMFRGSIEKDKAGKNWRHLENGKENDFWANCPLRILFLTKDQNGGMDHEDYWDPRGDAYHKPGSRIEDYVLDKRTAFNTNIVNILYGLVKTTPDTFIEYDKIDEKDAVKVSDEYPFARINCKKEVGGPSCPDNVFIKAIDDYSCYLKQQILNLDSDIFVCCGNYNKKNLILNFLNKIGYKFEYLNDESYSIYYDKEKNKIAIDLYHLSYNYYSREAMYNDAIKTYFAFLKSHPNFIKSHR